MVVVRHARRSGRPPGAIVQSISALVFVGCVAAESHAAAAADDDDEKRISKKLLQK